MIAGAKLVNVARRSNLPAYCSMCGDWRHRDPQSVAVTTIANNPLCARHLALVNAIRDDASHQLLPNRVPSTQSSLRSAIR